MAYGTDMEGVKASDLRVSDLKIYIIPGFIYRAFTRKHSLKDITDYKKVRPMFSVHDMAHLSYVEKYSFISTTPFWSSTAYNDYGGSECLFSHHKLEEKERIEINKSISLYAEQESFKKEMEEFYTVPKDENSLGMDMACVSDSLSGGEEVKLPYSIKVMEESVYIVVEEDFKSFFNKKEVMLDFLRRVLKSAYMVAPVSEVNQTAYFGQYIAALVAK